MLWALTVVAGVAALLMVIRAKGHADTDDFGSVSNHWIAEHRSHDAEHGSYGQ